MKGTGILLNDDYEVQVIPERDGTGKIIRGLQIGNTLFQNQALILMCQPGEIKVSPLVGVGIEDMLNDKNVLGWRRKIRQQMENDGQEVTGVIITADKNLNIDAEYRKS